MLFRPPAPFETGPENSGSPPRRRWLPFALDDGGVEVNLPRCPSARGRPVMFITRSWNGSAHLAARPGPGPLASYMQSIIWPICSRRSLSIVKDRLAGVTQRRGAGSERSSCRSPPGAQGLPFLLYTVCPRKSLGEPGDLAQHDRPRNAPAARGTPRRARVSQVA